MASDDEDEELMALRSAVLASMKQKVVKEEKSSATASSDIEDPELAALREAALKSKKAPGPSEPLKKAEVVPSEKPTHNVPAKQHGMPGKFNKFAGPGSNKQRGNLITIQTVPMEEEKPSPVRNAFLGKKGATKPEFTLLRPQDRWASSGGGSDSDRAGHTKPKVSDKFSRFESSGSDSEDESSDSDKSDNDKDAEDKSDSDSDDSGSTREDETSLKDGDDGDESIKDENGDYPVKDDDENAGPSEGMSSVHSNVEIDDTSSGKNTEQGTVSAESNVNHKDTGPKPDSTYMLFQDKVEPVSSVNNETVKTTLKVTQETKQENSRLTSSNVSESRTSRTKTAETKIKNRNSQKTQHDSRRENDSRMFDSDSSFIISDSDSMSDSDISSSDMSRSSKSEKRKSPQHRSVASNKENRQSVSLQKDRKKDIDYKDSCKHTIPSRHSKSQARSRRPSHEKPVHRRNYNNNSPDRDQSSSSRRKGDSDFSDKRRIARYPRSQSKERVSDRNLSRDRNSTRELVSSPSSKRDFSHTSRRFSPVRKVAPSVGDDRCSDSAQRESKKYLSRRAVDRSEESKSCDENDLKFKPETVANNLPQIAAVDEKMEARLRKFASSQVVQVDANKKISLKDIKKASLKKSKKENEKPSSSKSSKPSSISTSKSDLSVTRKSSTTNSSTSREKIASSSYINVRKSRSTSEVNAKKRQSNNGTGEKTTVNGRISKTEDSKFGDSSNSASSSSESSLSSLSDQESGSDSDAAPWRFTHTGKNDEPQTKNVGKVAYERESIDIERERRNRVRKKREEQRSRDDRRRDNVRERTTKTNREDVRSRLHGRDYVGQGSKNRTRVVVKNVQRFSESSSTEDEGPVRRSLVSVVQTNITANEKPKQQVTSHQSKRKPSPNDISTKRTAGDHSRSQSADKDSPALHRENERQFKEDSSPARVVLSPVRSSKESSQDLQIPSQVEEDLSKVTKSTVDPQRVVVSSREKNDARNIISRIKRRHGSDEEGSQSSTDNSQTVSITFDKGFDLKTSSRLPVHKRLGAQVSSIEKVKSAPSTERRTQRRVICEEPPTADKDRLLNRSLPVKPSKPPDDLPRKRTRTVGDLDVQDGPQGHKKIKILRRSGGGIVGVTSQSVSNADRGFSVAKPNPAEKDLDERIRQIQERNAAILKRKEEIERDKRQYGS